MCPTLWEEHSLALQKHKVCIDVKPTETAINSLSEIIPILCGNQEKHVTWQGKWREGDIGWGVQKSIPKKVSPGPVLRSRNIFGGG